jgi:hypothetical protein
VTPRRRIDLTAFFMISCDCNPDSIGVYQTQYSIYRYDGQRWRWFQTFPPNLRLWDVSVVSSSDAWLLGNTRDNNGNDISHLYRYDGAAWQAAAVPADVLYGIEMLSEQAGFISGKEHLWRYDGTGWSAIAVSPPNAGLTGENNEFQALDEQNLWLRDVGGYPGHADVYKFNGTAWQSTLPGVGVYSLSIISPTLGWAAGYAGAVRRYDGAAWPCCCTE